MSTMRVLAVRIAAAAMVIGGTGRVDAAGDHRVARQLPDPAAGAFANVYREGMAVRVALPAGLVETRPLPWSAMDVDGTRVAEGTLAAGADAVVLGALPVGWYRVIFSTPEGAEAGWTTAAVLAPRRLPARPDSPVCADSATAWFARNDAARQERFAVLAALAGVNWIRDRMGWGHLEPERGKLAEHTGYDTAAAAQAAAGLATLQVFHSTPGWAADAELDGKEAWKRFPRDLRDLHAFCRAMAIRYRGQVQAWEPWNEANITGFGGHTAAEMCTLQKAACLGFKAGDPGLIIGWNVYAGSPSETQKDIILANETWPYYDTFNVHTYSGVESYLADFAPAIAAACGKPLWLSECGVRLQFVTPPPTGELSPEDAWRQACFLPKSYASSLFAGVDRHFFFILGNYCENDIQFGLLRRDQTPRPGYSALAATGRFLDGARPLGRRPVRPGEAARVVAFRAFPDGEERDVLVVWGDGTRLPELDRLGAATVFDAIGRPVDAGRLAAPGEVPLFAVLPPGATAGMDLETPPARAAGRSGTPSPVVIQAQLPLASRRLGQQAHEVAAGAPAIIPIHVYHFGSEAVSGMLRVGDLPAGWRAEPSAWEVGLEPMARNEQLLTIHVPDHGRELLRGAGITVRGDFGTAGTPVLHFRLCGNPLTMAPSRVLPIRAALRADAWTDNIVGGSTLTHAPEDRGMRFDMRFGDADPWSYPYVSLDPEDRPDAEFDGLAFTIQVHEGSGTLRAQFGEDTGALHIADIPADPALRTPQEVVVFFEHASWGSWSRPDPDGALTPAGIQRVLLGINAKRQTTVSYSIRDLRWVRLGR